MIGPRPEPHQPTNLACSGGAHGCVRLGQPDTKRGASASEGPKGVAPMRRNGGPPPPRPQDRLDAPVGKAEAACRSSLTSAVRPEEAIFQIPVACHLADDGTLGSDEGSPASAPPAPLPHKASSRTRLPYTPGMPHLVFAITDTCWNCVYLYQNPHVHE